MGEFDNNDVNNGNAQSKAEKFIKPAFIRKLQITIILLLFCSSFINYLDRSALSVATQPVRDEFGMSGTQFGILLSAFSIAYGLSQLPAGFLLDKFKPRVVLGFALFLWSMMQALIGLSYSVATFIALRIGLGVCEAPIMPGGAKVINEWFNKHDKGTPLGLFNSGVMLSQALTPIVLVALIGMLGWRGMFVILGVAGIILGVFWFILYKNREHYNFTQDENEYFKDADVNDSLNNGNSITLKQWVSLFKLRTVWGFMIGFAGVNYTSWLYVTWLPGYLQTERGLSLANMGLVASIPFLLGAFGMLVSGRVVDWFINRGFDPASIRKKMIVSGLVFAAICTGFVSQAETTSFAVLFIGLALMGIHFAGTQSWGIVQAMVPAKFVASVCSIQNFFSFVIASFGPIVTGMILDATHSFSLAFIVCSGVTIVGALSYLFIVRNKVTTDCVSS